VSPMTYIRSLYPRDWDHFLERMGARLAGIEASAVRSFVLFFGKRIRNAFGTMPQSSCSTPVHASPSDELPSLHHARPTGHRQVLLSGGARTVL
jgi:hypothetical protein